MIRKFLSFSVDCAYDLKLYFATKGSLSPKLLFFFKAQK